MRLAAPRGMDGAGTPRNAEELGGVTLIPDGTGGVFEVRIEGNVIWSRNQRGRFPEIKELKQLVRDRIAPQRNLGHVDTPARTGHE